MPNTEHRGCQGRFAYLERNLVARDDLDVHNHVCTVSATIGGGGRAAGYRGVRQGRDYPHDWPEVTSVRRILSLSDNALEGGATVRIDRKGLSQCRRDR